MLYNFWLSDLGCKIFCLPQQFFVWPLTVQRTDHGRQWVVGDRLGSRLTSTTHERVETHWKKTKINFITHTIMDSHVRRRNSGNDVENHMQSIKCPQLVIHSQINSSILIFFLSNRLKIAKYMTTLVECFELFCSLCRVCVSGSRYTTLPGTAILTSSTPEMTDRYLPKLNRQGPAIALDTPSAGEESVS